MKAPTFAIAAWFPEVCWHRLVVRCEQPLGTADAEGPFIVPVHSCAVLCCIGAVCVNLHTLVYCLGLGLLLPSR